VIVHRGVAWDWVSMPILRTPAPLAALMASTTRP
jgi:hypothetical protein